MKNLSKIGASALAVSLVTGCSTAQVPHTQNFPASTQKVARSADHWDIVADDVAAQTVAAIGTKKTIYVAASSDTTDFNHAFQNFLITRMVNKGIPVSTHNDGTIEVQYETQVVKHNSERREYQPGTITELAAGLMVARNIHKWSSTGQAVAFLGAAAGIDALASIDSGSPTKTELVVTTSAIEGGRYLVRKTDIYYIQPEDVSLFEKNGFPIKEYRVVGER